MTWPRLYSLLTLPQDNFLMLEHSQSSSNLGTLHTLFPTPNALPFALPHILRELQTWVFQPAAGGRSHLVIPWSFPSQAAIILL